MVIWKWKQMPKGFTEREKELIRARLLENGRKAFSIYGLRKTNVEDLTQSIGVSKGAFYIFYDSKEALFMDVVEDAERNFRQQILSEADRPGPSPRARLKHVFQTAFAIWKDFPILQQVSQVEYSLLLEKMPQEKVRDHLQSDREFIDVLIQRCQEAGILIAAGGDHIAGLMNAMFFVSLHENDFGPEMFPGTMELLLDLISAYCVGEITTMGQPAEQPPGKPSGV
jgi:AcrR family transcriptional regulator